MTSFLVSKCTKKDLEATSHSHKLNVGIILQSNPFGHAAGVCLCRGQSDGCVGVGVTMQAFSWGPAVHGCACGVRRARVSRRAAVGGGGHGSPCPCRWCGMLGTTTRLGWGGLHGGRGAGRAGPRDAGLVSGSRRRRQGASQRGPEGREGDGSGPPPSDSGRGDEHAAGDTFAVGDRTPTASAVDAAASAVFLGFIRWYQRNVSPLTPAACRYLPTCSAFGVEAVQRFGPWRGGVLIALRISRCAPWGSPAIAYDPPVWPPPSFLPFYFHDQYADWEPPPDEDDSDACE